MSQYPELSLLFSSIQIAYSSLLRIQKPQSIIYYESEEAKQAADNEIRSEIAWVLRLLALADEEIERLKAQ